MLQVPVSPKMDSWFHKLSPKAEFVHNEGRQDPSFYSSRNLLAILEGPRREDRKGGNTSQELRQSDENKQSWDENEDDANADLSVEGSEREKVGLRQWIYHVVDSWIVGLFIVLIVAVDCIFFFAGFLDLLEGMALSRLIEGYKVVDWITVILYTSEVGARLFAYGIVFYFQSILRFIDALVVVLNLPAVVALGTTDVQWLKASRFIRLVRVVTVPILTRERELKWQAREELEELAVLLARERSEENRLTKWRIKSDSVAFGERLGSGSFGEVYLGLFRGTLVAVKQLYNTKNYQEEYSIEEEAVTLVNLRHPNVVLFMGFVHEPDKLWIVTEYCSRGSLRDLLEDPNMQLTENRVLRFALGAIRGLAYLHGQDPPVLHLDLKTSNVLVSSGWDTKLADFGLSRRIDAIENDTFAGTTQYSAPEILESNKFSEKADIYSFGICLWELAARQMPFGNLSATEVLWGVVKQQLRPDINIIRAFPDQQMNVSTHSLPRLVDTNSLCASPRVDNPKNSLILHKAANTRQTSAFDIDKNCEVRSSRCETKAKNDDIPLSTPYAHVPPLSELVASSAQNSNKSGTSSFASPHAKPSSPDRKTKARESPQSLKPGPEHVSSLRRSVRLADTIRKKSSLIGRSKSLLMSPLSPTAHKRRQSASFIISTAQNIRSPGKKPRTQQSIDLLTSRIAEKLELFEDRPYVARKSHLGVCQTPSSSTRSDDQSLYHSRKKSPRGSQTHSSPTDFDRQQVPLSSPKGKEDPSTPPMRSFVVEEHRQASKKERDLSQSLSGTNDPVKSSGVQMGNEYISLIKRCWAQNPADRPEANEVVWKLVGLIDNQLKLSAGNNAGGASQSTG